MKGPLPEQAALTPGTDMTRTDVTRRVIDGMADGLGDGRIGDVGAFSAQGFGWHGNHGRGQKRGLHGFRESWRKPFRAAFEGKVRADEARLFGGEEAAAFGRQEAIHAGGLMGLAPTGTRVEARYMDLRKVQDGRTVGDRVMVGFPRAMAQLGLDAFGGHGREAFGRGDAKPPAPWLATPAP